MAAAPKSSASRLQGPPAAGPASTFRLRAARALRLHARENDMSAGYLAVEIAAKAAMSIAGHTSLYRRQVALRQRVAVFLIPAMCL